MAIETVPEWMAGLEDEDVAFIKKFLLASGSLKEVCCFARKMRKVCTKNEKSMLQNCNIVL